MTTNTTSKPLKHKNKFISFFGGNKFGSAYIKKTQQESLQAHLRLNVPTLKEEYWKYTKIAPYLEKNYLSKLSSIKKIDDYHISGLDTYPIVFVNGFFAKEHSNTYTKNQLLIESLGKASFHYADLFNKHYAKYADYNTHYFIATNTAHPQDGVFVSVPDNTIFDKPIHIIHITADNNLLKQPRNLFIVGKNSKVKIIQTYHSLEGMESFTNEVTEIILQENAQMDYYLFQDENNNSSQVCTTQVFQQMDSRFLSNTFTLGGEMVRNNLNVVVDGEGCQTDLYGLYMVKGSQHVDNHTYIEHKQLHCTSNEKYKGIVSDNATGVFNGKVYVARKAQKTNAFQSNQNILLSDDAKVYSKPELEIYADDVKCSHGSTTGQLNEEAIFYFRSRGIGEDTATQMLLQAFTQKVLDSISIPPLKKMIEARLKL